MHNETRHCCCLGESDAVADTGNDFDADGYWNYPDGDSTDRNSMMNSTAKTKQKTTISKPERSFLRTERLEFDDELEQ